MSAKTHETKDITQPVHCRRTKRLYILMKMAAMPLLFLLVTTALRGQSALDGFDPNANGTIRAVVVQPDGKILIGGLFTTLSPNGGAAVARNHIARLNPDGTLDSTFNPNANDDVYSIALQADGKILVAGPFHSIGGQTRNHIARLDATTGLADSFDPNANDTLTSIAVQADGRILAGGAFTTIGGQPRNYIARLDATTGLADSFDPNANTFIYTLAVQADGKILVGGDFDSIGGQTRNHIARLDPATGLADSFDPNSNSYVYAFAVQADGKILVGGGFNGANSIGGQTRNYIARLDAATGTADSFDPNANSTVSSILVQADGKVLVAGGFTSIGGQTRNRIARLDAATGLVDSFDPNVNGFIYAIAVQADGKILAGGNFTAVTPAGGASATRNRIARLETDGRLDQTVNVNAVGFVLYATAFQRDGKILLGGWFDSVLGQTRHNLARLNNDGTLDTAFNPNVGDPVVTIAVQADDKILIGGSFTSVGGQTRNYIARIDSVTGLPDSFDPNAAHTVLAITVQPDGKILVGGSFEGILGGIGGQPRNRIGRLDPVTGLADSWDPDAQDDVWAIALQPDGKILVGGDFVFIGGPQRNHIARLDATTGLADEFNPNSDGLVQSIAVQADGKILVSGGFANVGGQSRLNLARLDSTTGLADAFNPAAGGAVYSIAVQADGKILAGGNFQTIGGQSRHNLARLDATTGLADSFDPNATPCCVYSTTLQPDGKILVGGSFNNIGGQPRDLFARITNDTAALRTLVVAQNQVTWLCDGASPQFGRVRFESSSDNVTYTSLGDGVPVGRNWILSGLNLSTTTNFYLRARGYPNGQSSGIFLESIKYGPAGLPTPTPSPTPSATPTPTPSVTPPIPTPTPTPTAHPATPTPTPTPTATPTPSAAPHTFGNISTRLRVETGENVLIGGFIVTGTQPKRVIVRAIGPSLSSFFPGALADPVLELRDSSGALIGSNDNWRSDQEAEIIATTVAPSDNLESAIVAILPANGSNYTAIVRGANDGTGIGVVEAYDLDRTVNSKLANISTRGLVQTGDNVMIGGMIVLGQTPLRVIVRAIGPSLPVSGALGDPTLELRDGNGTLLAANDNWRSDQEAEIIATTIPPSDNLESAIVQNLAPGNYTAIVRGANDATGIAVVEAYALN